MLDPILALLALATACPANEPARVPVDAHASEAAPVERARDAEAQLLEFAGRYADSPGYASDALLRAAVLARDAGSTERERAHLERILRRDYPDTDAGAWARYLVWGQVQI